MNTYEKTIKDLNLDVIICKKDIETSHDGIYKKGSKYSLKAKNFFAQDSNENSINIFSIKYEYDDVTKPLLINILGKYYALTYEKLYQFGKNQRYTTIQGNKMGEVVAIKEVEFEHFRKYFLTSTDRIRKIAKDFLKK